VLKDGLLATILGLSAHFFSCWFWFCSQFDSPFFIFGENAGIVLPPFALLRFFFFW